jgi:4-diphosphocytidyl-2-C-methyl-D-erythritol kinase
VQKQGFSLPSFAKINLNLRVLGRRDDGFHEIVTVLQTISLQDTLTFEPSEKGIELICDEPSLPGDDTNLIIKAARALQAEFQVGEGASIQLKKLIPMGGGLGGGSSNAAVALLGISRLWSLDVSVERLHRIAADLGSDVPFFLHGGTASALGTGTTIEPIPDVSVGPMIVVTPDAKVSTREAYENLAAASLTTEDAERILLNYRLEAEDPVYTVNDFEQGSGASVFGIFENEETRQTALKALGERTDWRSFAVAAVSRSEYREKLGL